MKKMKIKPILTAGLLVCGGFLAAVFIGRYNTTASNPAECAPEAAALMRSVALGTAYAEVLNQLRVKQLHYVVNEAENHQGKQVDVAGKFEMLIPFREKERLGFGVGRKSQVVLYFDSSHRVTKRECSVVFIGP